VASSTNPVWKSTEIVAVRSDHPADSLSARSTVAS